MLETDEWGILSTGYEETAGRNKKRIDFFLELSEELGKDGVEIIPLKGIDLLLRAYPMLGLRPMADMDLLIREGDSERVRSWFERKGFERSPEEALVYLSRDKTLNLDMIWKIWYLGDVSALWRRSVVSTVRGVPVKFLHPEDALLYLVAYVVAHRGVVSRLFVEDLRFFLDRQGDQIDWDRWVERVRNLKLNVAVHHGFSYANQNGLSCLPEKVLTALRPSSPGERILARFYRLWVTDAGTPEVSYVFTWLRHPGFMPKLRLLREKLMPSRAEMELRYGQRRDFQYALIFLTHPVAILFKSLFILARDILLLLSRKS